jgi:hypothetical protein
MSRGIAGITRKTFVRKLTNSSQRPPTYAALIPSTAAITVATAPAARPSRSERRAPRTTCEKMSLPWSVVPKRWFHEGACRAARRSKSFGCATEMSGAMSAMTTTKPTMMRPMHDLGFFRSSTSQPGACSRPLTRIGGAARSRLSVGSSCDISCSAAAGRGRG